MTTVMTGDAMAFDERRIPRNGHMLLARDYAGVDPAFVLMHGFPDNLGIYDRLAPILAAAGRGSSLSTSSATAALTSRPNIRIRHRTWRATWMPSSGLSDLARSFRSPMTLPDRQRSTGRSATGTELRRSRYSTHTTTLRRRSNSLSSSACSPIRRTANWRRRSPADPLQFGWLLTFQGRRFLHDAPPAMRELMEQEFVRIIRGQFAASPSAAAAFISLTRELHSAIVENTRLVQELSEFRPKVGLIWGIGDPYLNAGVAEHLKGLFPNSRLTALNLGHWPQIEAPEEVAKSLLGLDSAAS